MNFADLYKKISNIDKGIMEDVSLEECPSEDKPEMEHEKQPSSVSASLNINGQGADGIRDMISILRDIEQHKYDDAGEEDGEIIFGGDLEDSYMEDGYENSIMGGSEPEVYGVGAITKKGNDLNSHGGNETPKVSGGGNPYPIKESLLGELAKLYQDVKLR